MAAAEGRRARPGMRRWGLLRDRPCPLLHPSCRPHALGCPTRADSGSRCHHQLASIEKEGCFQAHGASTKTRRRLDILRVRASLDGRSAWGPARPRLLNNLSIEERP